MTTIFCYVELDGDCTNCVSVVVNCSFFGIFLRRFQIHQWLLNLVWKIFLTLGPCQMTVDSVDGWSVISEEPAVQRIGASAKSQPLALPSSLVGPRSPRISSPFEVSAKPSPPSRPTASQPLQVSKFHQVCQDHNRYHNMFHH